MAIKAVKLCGLKENLIYRSLKKLKDVSAILINFYYFFFILFILWFIHIQ